ncbi:MAG: hypothetical protein QJR07_11825 [Acetobacteraceae bacterium]|nr:hypothetical protein [Acetobacteraceae bacterium]MDI3307779.1 hypothetical protein [Acetobacteraceae bacterium]
METHHSTDPFLTIPAPPRHAGPQEQRSPGRNALWEASLVGLLALSAAWALAELATAIRGF